MKFLHSVSRGRHAGIAHRRIRHEGIGDRWLIASILALCTVGIIMVYDSSVAIALRDFSDQYHFVREQIKWLLLGSVAFTVMSRVPYPVTRKFALPAFIGTLVLLVAVFIPGFGVRALGAHRWLNFGLFVLQPAELAKLTGIIYLSAWFSSKESGRLTSFLLYLGMVVGLIVLEPDLGTSIVVLSTSLTLYFLSGAPLIHFAALVPVLLAGIGGLAVAAPYRLRRVMTFLNPEADPLGSSYQIRQVLIALGSGGLFGLGIGKSRQKYEYLPEANTDSILAILGEELGFAGTLIVILIFLFLIWRCFKIARRVHDPYGKLLSVGIGSWIAIQVIINVGSMVALMPLTGIPLPLISYGGSNLVITLGALGIVYNISTRTYDS